MLAAFDITLLSIVVLCFTELLRDSGEKEASSQGLEPGCGKNL